MGPRAIILPINLALKIVFPYHKSDKYVFRWLMIAIDSFTPNTEEYS